MYCMVKLSCVTGEEASRKGMHIFGGEQLAWRILAYLMVHGCFAEHPFENAGCHECLHKNIISFSAHGFETGDGPTSQCWTGFAS